MAKQTQEKKVSPEKFIYLFGDDKKTPIDFSAQAPGTRCVLVTPSGLEYEMVAGTSKLAPPMTPEVQAKLDRMKKWDPVDEKFPNLKVAREG